MENYVSAQLGELGAAAAMGAATALVYDLLRALRLLDRRDRLLTHLLDALFAASVGAGALWLALVVGGGELRLYMLSAMALGALGWFWLLSPYLRPLWEFWASALSALGRLLWRPVDLAWRGGKKIAAKGKKGFSFLAKCVRMKLTAIGTRRAENARKKGGSAMAADKKTRTKKKKLPVPVLLLMAALVVALGIQIVRVYGQLHVAQREETALDQQLTQQQEANEALRSDLARKDDESFIKALARDLLGLAEEGERIFYDVNN